LVISYKTLLFAKPTIGHFFFDKRTFVGYNKLYLTKINKEGDTHEPSGGEQTAEKAEPDGHSL
jgi:hypothetical protein